MSNGVRAAITGVGAYVPEKVLTNADLEQMVDTSDEWITKRTGIKERRIAGEGETTGTMSTQAARRACADAGIAPAELVGMAHKANVRIGHAARQYGPVRE